MIRDLRAMLILAAAIFVLAVPLMRAFPEIRGWLALGIFAFGLINLGMLALRPKARAQGDGRPQIR